MALYRHMLARRGRRAGAGRPAGAVERPPADHDLARRAGRCSSWSARRRRSATGSPTTCSAPGTCRSTTTRVIHGDPHLGNYTARPDLTINLIDFGCIRVFRPTLVQGVIDLYWALVRGDRDLAVHAYETWGFADLRKEVIDTLNLWAAFVYAPLMEDRPRLIEETNSGAQGRDGRLQRAAAAARDRRGHAAARVRADGPRRDRPRLGVHAPPGRGQLAPAVHGA